MPQSYTKITWQVTVSEDTTPQLITFVAQLDVQPVILHGDLWVIPNRPI